MHAYGLGHPIASLAEQLFAHPSAEDQSLLTEDIEVQVAYNDASLYYTNLVPLHLEGYPHKILLPALRVYLVCIKIIAFVNEVCERQGEEC